ncbi:MAG: HAD-IA family hydrolase [Luteolibacter sp.]
MPRAIIFDLDGTLVESLPGIAASLNLALSHHRLPTHDHAAVRSFIGDGAQMLVQRAVPETTPEETRASILKCFAEDYAVSWPTGTSIYPGIQELLADLSSKNIPLAVLSNKPHPFTVEIVEKLFPENTFAATLGNREGLAHKPDPTGALEIASSLNLPPQQCTVIGDSTMDLDTAKNAGMQSIAVTWGYHDRERLAAADAIVDDVAELEASLVR